MGMGLRLNVENTLLSGIHPYIYLLIFILILLILSMGFQEKRAIFSLIQIFTLFALMFFGLWKTVSIVAICWIFINLIIEVAILLAPEYKEMIENRNSFKKEK